MLFSARTHGRNIPNQHAPNSRCADIHKITPQWTHFPESAGDSDSGKEKGDKSETLDGGKFKTLPECVIISLSAALLGWNVKAGEDEVTGERADLSKFQTKGKTPYSNKPKQNVESFLGFVQKYISKFNQPKEDFGLLKYLIQIKPTFKCVFLESMFFFRMQVTLVFDWLKPANTPLFHPHTLFQVSFCFYTCAKSQ